MLFESFLLGNIHLPLNLLLVSASVTINQVQVACPHGQFCCLISWEANEEEEMTLVWVMQVHMFSWGGYEHIVCPSSHLLQGQRNHIWVALVPGTSLPRNFSAVEPR